MPLYNPSAGGGGLTVDAAQAGGFALIEDLPPFQRADSASVTVSKWIPVGVALAACVVRGALILPTGGGFTGSGVDYYKFHLCVSRASDDYPLTLTGGGTNLREIGARASNSSASGFLNGKPWNLGLPDASWDQTAAVMQPEDVVGVYAEKVGAPAAGPQANQIYAIRVEPIGVS